MREQRVTSFVINHVPITETMYSCYYLIGQFQIQIYIHITYKWHDGDTIHVLSWPRWGGLINDQLPVVTHMKESIP